MSAPRTPADVPEETGLVALAEAVLAHSMALLDHRYGISDPLPAGEFVGHVLAELAISAVLADRVTRGRWVLVRDALAAGATVEQVAAAIGADVAGIRIGLGLWASNQRRFNLITDEQHEAVRALLRETP